MALKILQVTRVPSTQWHFLMPLNRELRARGHQVNCACSRGADLQRIRGAGFDAHEIPLDRSLAPGNLFNAIRALRRLMRQERYDVVITHMLAGGGVGRIAARWARVPCTIHIPHGMLPMPWMKGLRWLGHLGLSWLAAGWQHGLIVLNEHDWQLVRKYALARPPETLFRVAGMGVEMDRWTNVPAEELAAKRAELGLPPGAPVVLMTARTVPDKGVVEYVQAAIRLIQTGRAGSACFLLAGNGPLDEKLRGLVTTAGLAGRLRLLGWREDMPLLVGLCDLYVLSSYAEGLPISIVEAMAAGKPVVSTRVRGCEDAVSDGVTGLLVPPRDPRALADAMARLLDDPDLRQRFGQAGRRMAAERYDAGRLAVQMADIVETVARRRGLRVTAAAAPGAPVPP
jgi:glycosyltransferase involved in cell wall biosynthesis